MKILAFILASYLCVSSLGGSTGGSDNSTHGDDRLVFLGSGGSKIIIDLAERKITEPGGQVSDLQDCSDDSQLCFTSKTGFVLSLYKRCEDSIVSQGAGLSFKRRTVWALHGDSWFFYEEAPNYLFQDRENRGIVAIYTGANGDFNFSDTLRDRTLTSDSVLFNRHQLISKARFGDCKD